MVFNHEAIRAVYPNVSIVDDDEGCFDFDGNPVEIDQALVDVEIARLDAISQSTQYQRDRQAEYPPLEELMVALWESVIEDRAADAIAIEALRQEIKLKYPKP